MRNKRFPKYPNDTDYNTNSNSYYDDLARKQKLIQLLAEKIWDYDERLDERLEDLENVLQDYLSQWDTRIENLDDEVSHIFVTWLNDGTLEQIINHDVLGNKADKSFVDSEIERLDQKDENLTTQLAQTKNSINEYMVNIKDFGAIGDGLEHPLSEKYDTLENARKDYPFADSLDDLIDWCALYSASLKVEENGGGTIYVPKGQYIVNFVTKINVPTKVIGHNKDDTIIKLSNQSRLFHNPNRDNTEFSTDLNHLYRNFHALFFVNDTSFELNGIFLDGNPRNQTDRVGGVDFHYAYGHLTPERNYFKYVHGIITYYTSVDVPYFNIIDCEISGFSWTNVSITAKDGYEFYPINARIENTIFGESSNDQLHLNRIKNVVIKDSTFRNPNTHSVHAYVDTSDILIKNNKFIVDDSKFLFHTKPAGNRNNMIVLSHDSYTYFKAKNIEIIGNKFVNLSTLYQMAPLVVYNNVSDVTVKDNDMYNITSGIIANSGIVQGYNTFINNRLWFSQYGFNARIFKATGELQKPDVTGEKIRSHWDIIGNTFNLLGDAAGYRSIDLRTYNHTINNDEDIELVSFLIKDNIGESYLMPTPSNQLTYDVQDSIYNEQGKRIDVDRAWYRNFNTIDTPITEYEPHTLSYRMVGAEDAVDYPEQLAGLVITYATITPNYSYEDFIVRFSGSTYRRWWDAGQNKWSEFKKVE